MTQSTHRGRPTARHVRRMMAFLLLLVPAPAAGGSPASAADDARVRSESQKIAANQQRVLRDNEKRISEIQSRETGVDEARRAQKVTADRALAAGGSRHGAGLPGRGGLTGA